MGIAPKIAIICNYELLPQRVGGMDYFFWMFNKKCKENGIDTDWYFPNAATYGEYSSLRIIPFGDHPEHFFLANLGDDGAKYSHVMTHFIELCTSSLKKIKGKTGARIIAVDHNPRPLGGYNYKKKIEKRLKGLLYAKFIDVFVAVSKQAQHDLLLDFGRFIKPKCNVIFNGLDPAKFKTKISFHYRGRFIIASHLRQAKGIQDVIKAVHGLSENEKVDLAIDVYGIGPFEAHLKKMLQDFSLESIFNFKGSVDNLNEIYADYDYLIHPSHAETFCYTVVESLMSNLPIITTNKQGNVLGLVKENSNGFLFEPGDFNGLRKVLTDVISGRIGIEKSFMGGEELNSMTLEQMVENYFKLLS